MTLHPYLDISNQIRRAMITGRPVVALESAVITHGLPFPNNLSLANSLEAIIREENALPATIGLLDGKIRVGLTSAEIERLATATDTRKISRRDFGIALANRIVGGTTVAGTLFAASQAGIEVFATGGIGGVHRNAPLDISADLHELSRTPMVVICAGAKAILDLPATLEVLETLGVPVIGYQTAEFPAFYSPSSGLPVNFHCETPSQIAAIARAHWNAGLNSAILVANPPPTENSLPGPEIEAIIQQAVQEAELAGIQGAAVTPYLLNRVASLSGGASLETNLALLQNNARLAARIAAELIQPTSQVRI